MSKNTAQILKGFRDYLSQEQIARNKIVQKISEIFERFGFAPMDTPAMEMYELLGGKYGDEGEQLMYKFKDQGDRLVALRYDLTVPLSRVLAMHPDLPKPFKRYQIGLVWRAEKPQKGRFRELMQCDVDVVGSTSILADAEVIAALFSALKYLEVGDVLVKINNRQLIDRALAELKIPDVRRVNFMRILDKTDKIGKNGVNKLLVQEGFDKNVLDEYERTLKGLAFDYQGEIQNLLGSFEVANIEFDPFLMRGMDYYTGIIFEFILKDKPEFGSIAGGGRYDNLIGRVASEPMPAVGGSIGLDRLFAALTEAGKIAPQSAAEVIILNMDKKLSADYLNMATNLRNAGIDCEVFYEPVKLDKQFRYAQAKNMKLAVIYGSAEAESGRVNVKDLEQKRQETVDLEDLATTVKSMLW